MGESSHAPQSQRQETENSRVELRIATRHMVRCRRPQCYLQMKKRNHDHCVAPCCTGGSLRPSLALLMPCRRTAVTQWQGLWVKCKRALEMGLNGPCVPESAFTWLATGLVGTEFAAIVHWCNNFSKAACMAMKKQDR